MRCEICNGPEYIYISLPFGHEDNRTLVCKCCYNFIEKMKKIAREKETNEWKEFHSRLYKEDK